MPLAGFEPAVSASERSRTDVIDRAVIETAHFLVIL